jgi:hypothetical protein
MVITWPAPGAYAMKYRPIMTSLFFIIFNLKIPGKERLQEQAFLAFGLKDFNFFD